ncbi:transmembrane protein, putative [Rhizoctonia solani AG-3 Rhs1AP]|uniref:Transmembrane protein, putative n=2 Tax=Rhizoctonia solani AG-3 TaxID=1086053 RepID=X8J9M5_9AGAM|nr:transmembrane protein, putative [Rhizoctonia solani AG-3 Rhs1AP]KEP47479.1 putative transmembrane protein [Rhizoctonia solani 123E]
MKRYIPMGPPRLPLSTIQPTSTMVSTMLMLAALVGNIRSATAQQSPTECADGSMTSWMQNNEGKNPCELVQDVLRVCKPSFNLGFLPRGYACENAPGSALAPCCCGSPTFALMSACWSCQYNITFDLVSTTFTGFVKDCQTLPNPITSYDTSVQSRITALDLPPWSQAEPLAGKWDFTGAWRNSTPSSTSAPPVPTGYPIQVNSTGISKGALAGAIVGAILGSKILFMAAGYLFYRWWKKEHGNENDEERNYVHHVFGEPKYPRRAVTRRSRRGSRVHVDLDEETASPRSSRWLGIPSYLQPTSFHSHSSATSGPPIPGQQELDPHHISPGAYVNAEEGGVTPFVSNQRPVESEKTRARRQSTLLRVANNGMTSEEDNNAPAPQPELLAHANSVSPGPVSPPAALNSSRILSTTSRSNSHAGSISTSNLHGHSVSVGSGSGSGTRYQEDDAGVSIVIEDGSESPEPVRSVPPAYVDYRKGYSDANLDKGDLHRHGSAQADGSNNTHGESSRSGGSEAGRRGETSDSATCINTPSDPPSPKKIEAEIHDTDTVGAKTMTETDTVREPDHRDRHESGDSEGAATIKPLETETPGPIERASTTDLAALTAANTAANRPNSPGSIEPSQPARPPHLAHTSAPAGVTFSKPMSQDHASSEHDVRQASDNASPSTNETPPSANSAPWSWSRALGAFGLGGTNTPSS